MGSPLKHQLQKENLVATTNQYVSSLERSESTDKESVITDGGDIVIENTIIPMNHGNENTNTCHNQLYHAIQVCFPPDRVISNVLVVDTYNVTTVLLCAEPEEAT